MIRVAGIVLCGGQSRRMGRPKAWLPFGPETLLQRVVRLVSIAADPVIVVAAVDQDLPPLPADVQIARDQRDQAGPLEGLRAGLAAMAIHQPASSVNGPDNGLVESQSGASLVEAVFATACDTPLIRPELIRFLASQLGTHDAVVPFDGNYFHPLTAVYRLTSWIRIETLLAQGESRLSAACEQLDTLALPIDQLQIIDPQLESLLNINHPEQYENLQKRFPLSRQSRQTGQD